MRNSYSDPLPNFKIELFIYFESQIRILDIHPLSYGQFANTYPLPTLAYLSFSPYRLFHFLLSCF